MLDIDRVQERPLPIVKLLERPPDRPEREEEIEGAPPGPPWKVIVRRRRPNSAAGPPISRPGGERLLDALEQGKISADLLHERLLRLEQERLAKYRTALERLKLKVTPIPTVEMFRELADQMKRKMEEGPTREAKAFLRRLVGRIIAQPDGALKVELLAGSPRNTSGSNSGFDIRREWWRWGESNPRPRTCQ